MILALLTWVNFSAIIQSSLLQQTLACSILTALLSEFSSSSKTSSIGLSMEFHGSCKRGFQVGSPPCFFFFLCSLFFITWIHSYFSFSSSITSSPPGGKPASDLHVDHGGTAGVQPQRKPQRPDVVCLPALPGSGQPGPQLEFPAAQSYPLYVSGWPGYFLYTLQRSGS